MTLLETIVKVSSNQGPDDLSSEFPTVLNPDFSLLKAKNESPNLASLVSPITGWQLSKADRVVFGHAKDFCNGLSRKLKNTNKFNKEAFVESLRAFLEKVRVSAGISIAVDKNDPAYTCVMMENLGFLMGKKLTGLVLEACLAFELWQLLSSMITVSGIIDSSFYPNLVLNLVSKRRSDLIVLCIKQAPDLKTTELFCILKYFLCPPGDSLETMVSVRCELEEQGKLSIKHVKDTKLNGEKLQLARDAAVLLMLALDGFSDPELCLHYLLASPNIDEAILSFSISKLNGQELTSMITYLGKWLRKYERFPQAIPCPRAASLFGLSACNWVPKLEDVIKHASLLLDENFSSLVLHTEFHEELRSMANAVSSLTAEARLCALTANVVETILKEDNPGVV